MHSTWIETINKNVPGANAVLETRADGDSPVFVEAAQIKKICQTLRDHSSCAFNVLQVITGCDYEDRIEVSYILANFTDNTELILKTKLPRQGPQIDSVVDIWPAANFQERECFDMLGVEFKGHPDPRRILCPDDWEGFPLRRDYVAAEKYRHMTINPVAKMNIPEREFAKKQKAAEDAAKANAKKAGNPETPE